MAGSLGCLDERLQRDLRTLLEETADDRRHFMWHEPFVLLLEVQGLEFGDGSPGRIFFVNYSNPQSHTGLHRSCPVSSKNSG